MDQIAHFFTHLFDASAWPPRWYCGQWTPFHGWLYIISDLGIWVAYMSIPLWLAIFVTRRPDVPFHKIFWLFIAFIMLCGTTHLVDALGFWWPAYRFNALVRFATALVSLGTVLALVPVLPKAFALRTPEALEREIVERRRAEKSLRDYTRQLQVANKELEAFSYSVSHDLRTPLRSINGYSQALLEDYGDKLDEEGFHYLERIRASSQKMAELIDDLLNLARVSRVELNQGEADLSQLAREIAEELRERDPERDVEFNIASGLQATGDSRLLRVVLENLLGNAWKFTRDRRPAVIEFASRQEDGQTVYFVRDNGVGFDMSYKDKLFQAFHRLHGSEFPGSGIGLATVQRILNRHGGSIRAESTVGQGTTFYFELSGDELERPGILPDLTDTDLPGTLQSPA